MEKQSRRRPKPWLAVLITLVVLGLAIQDQLKSGTVDRWTLGALLVLAFYWSGHSVDRILDRWFS